MTMRRIAIVNQKGGVGKTTTAVNLGAALALAGRRVVLLDLDPQGNLSTHLDIEIPPGEPSTYQVLCDGLPFRDALRDTSTPGLRVSPTNIDLSGAEMELASALGRESILNDAIDTWVTEHYKEHGEDPADYLIVDCPPSLGLLSVNGLVASREVFIALQTEFFALQGMSKLVEIVQLLKRRLNPDLVITGIIPCLYDSRLRLAREVLAEIRKYFPGPVFNRSIRKSVKLAEAPSYGLSIFGYAPSSPGAGDYAELAQEVLAQEVAPIVETPLEIEPQAEIYKQPKANPILPEEEVKAQVEPVVSEVVFPQAVAPEAEVPETVVADVVFPDVVLAAINLPNHANVESVKPEAASSLEAGDEGAPPETVELEPASQMRSHEYNDSGTVTPPRRTATKAADLPPLPESAFRVDP